MCKIFLMAGITKETNDKAVKLIKAMAEPMSNGNTDGLGYSAVKEDGSMFGERWYVNNRAFKNKPLVVETPEYIEMMESLGEAIKPDKHVSIDHSNIENKYGDVDLSKMVAITMHTRFATSGREFKNTHPFYDEAADTSLIHNGVIRNTQDFTLTLSTCDSEAVLISYLKQQVNHHPENVSEMSKMLKGYYACGVFSRDAEGKRIMDVFKSSATLSGAFIKELGVMVYTTNISDLESSCIKVGLTIGPKFTCNDGWLFRLDPITGKVVCKMPFKESSNWEYDQSTYSKGHHGGYYNDEYDNFYNERAFNKENNNELSTTSNIVDMTKKKIFSLGMVGYMKLPAHTRVLNIREVTEINKSLREA